MKQLVNGMRSKHAFIIVTRIEKMQNHTFIMTSRFDHKLFIDIIIPVKSGCSLIVLPCDRNVRLWKQ